MLDGATINSTIIYCQQWYIFIGIHISECNIYFFLFFSITQKLLVELFDWCYVQR